MGDWVGRERLEIGGALGPEEEPVGRDVPTAAPEKQAKQDGLLLQGNTVDQLESQGRLGRGPWRKSREIRAKVLRNGVMRAPTDDPLRFRDDLTGLHLRCATLQVRLQVANGVLVLSFHCAVSLLPS